MITAFKITKMPLRTVLKILNTPMVLEQEYPISEQSTMTADVIDRGVPFDIFTYKLKSDTGTWSSNFQVRINVEVGTGTPDIPTASLVIANNSTVEITSLFVPNDSTDRLKINSLTSGVGELWIDGAKAVIGKTYMLYDFKNVYFVSNIPLTSQNKSTVITLQAGNKNEFAAEVDINIETSGNLQGTINATSDMLWT